MKELSYRELKEVAAAVAIPVIGSVPGWTAGTFLGSLRGAAGYGATCWW